MFTELLVLKDLYVPLAMIAGAVIIGIVIEKIFLVQLKKFATRTKWGGDEIIVGALQGLGILWFGIAGIFSALAYLPLKPAISSIISRVLLVIAILSATIMVAKIIGGLLRSKGVCGNHTAGARF